MSKNDVDLLFTKNFRFYSKELTFLKVTIYKILGFVSVLSYETYDVTLRMGTQLENPVLFLIARLIFKVYIN